MVPPFPASGLRASGQVSVVHTTDSLHARQGGPPRTISALATGLGRLGADVSVLAFEDGHSRDAVTPAPDAARVQFVERGRGGVQRFRRAITAASPALVHDHGLWLPSNHAAARPPLRLDIPRVVSTRGMLEPWARQHRRWKKALAWAAFQGRDLRAAAVLHATAESEADHLRDLGLRSPIAVIPNGVDVPDEVAPHGNGPEASPGAPSSSLAFTRRRGSHSCSTPGRPSHQPTGSSSLQGRTRRGTALIWRSRPSPRPRERSV